MIFWNFTEVPMLELCFGWWSYHAMYPMFPSSLLISSYHHWKKGSGGTYIYIFFPTHSINCSNRRAQRDKCHLTFTFSVISWINIFLPTALSLTDSSNFFYLVYTNIKDPYHWLIKQALFLLFHKYSFFCLL